MSFEAHIFQGAANSAPKLLLNEFRFLYVHLQNMAIMAMALNASRVLKFVADEIEDAEFVESSRICIDLPIMVQEICLPGRATRQHFLQWDPRVFRPGSIWCTVSFRPDGKVTDNQFYLFVAVVFFVDNRIRKGGGGRLGRPPAAPAVKQPPGPAPVLRTAARRRSPQPCGASTPRPPRRCHGPGPALAPAAFAVKLRPWAGARAPPPHCGPVGHRAAPPPRRPCRTGATARLRRLAGGRPPLPPPSSCEINP
jgi:hypothetical protein